MNIIHHQNHLSITTALSHLTTPTPSYSVRRIRAEYLAATKNGPTSPQCDFLSFRPFSPDHLFDIIGTIAGPVGSPYEGGIFHIHIHIPALYPDLPPICTFMTKIWHPNVGPYGEVCLNILQDEWSQALSVRTVLLSISAMLGDPGMAVEGGNAVYGFANVEAGSMWMGNPRVFEMAARDWTRMRSALSTLLAEQEKAATEGGLTPDGSPLLHPSPQAYYWAFDIYEQEKMESDLLATLKGNHDDPNKSDSDGYVLISILDDLAAKTENERQQLLKAGNFGPWLQSTYGLNRSQGPRVLAITTAPFWRDLWRSYVMTPYGEKFFNFTTAEDIASTKLEKLWAREIDFVLTFDNRIFEGKKVTSADWETVLAAMEKGPRADFLRRLFFPTKADHEDGGLTGDTFTTSSTQVNTRRPGFLAKLSDVEYHKVFINMQQNPGLTCPRWGDFVRTNRLIAQPMKKVLQHVIYWTDQSLSYPRSSSNALKHWDWVEELGKSAFRAEVNPRPWRHVDEGSTDIQPKFTITSLPDHIGKFMEQLWTYIETEPLWRDVTVVKQQLKLPTDKKQAIRNQLSDETELFSAMFCYRELKKVMISTLTHRYGGGSKRRSEQLSFLLDKKEWEVARAELIEYSMTLNRRGIMVNADQLNESLERLALPTHANPVAEDGEPIMGFLEMDPESYGLEQQGNTERLQELLARTLDKEIDSL
ncbi:ubiquitin-conjugating enzyme E2 1 [Aspergillus niger]|nr:ubiquitin-conjugating enzyme E2 1 [Aspergillus niger]